jgi:hypothetical protein
VVSFPGISQPGRESDHSPASSAEDKNEWSYASAAPIYLQCMPSDFMYYICVCVCMYTPLVTRNLASQHLVGFPFLAIQRIRRYSAWLKDGPCLVTRGPRNYRNSVSRQYRNLVSRQYATRLQDAVT